MASSMEIRCKACGRLTLARAEPVYEDFKKTAETFVCSACGHRYPSRDKTPFVDADGRPRVFSDADKPVAAKVFKSDERRRSCAWCRYFIVNPFCQRCGLSNRLAEATDVCARFQAKPEPPVETIANKIIDANRRFEALFKDELPAPPVPTTPPVPSTTPAQAPWITTPKTPPAPVKEVVQDVPLVPLAPPPPPPPTTVTPAPAKAELPPPPPTTVKQAPSPKAAVLPLQPELPLMPPPAPPTATTRRVVPLTKAALPPAKTRSAATLPTSTPVPTVRTRKKAMAAEQVTPTKPPATARTSPAPTVRAKKKTAPTVRVSLPEPAASEPVATQKTRRVKTVAVVPVAPITSKKCTAPTERPAKRPVGRPRKQKAE